MRVKMRIREAGMGMTRFLYSASYHLIELYKKSTQNTSQIEMAESTGHSKDDWTRIGKMNNWPPLRISPYDGFGNCFIF